MERTPLTPAEAQWVAVQVSVAVGLARAYTGDSEDLPTLARLDKTWLSWQTDTSSTKADANAVVNGLGIAFGRHLANSLGLDWAIVSDEYGTDLALYGDPGAVTFFPANMISKRLGERQPIFTQLHRAATDGVTQLRAKIKP